MKRLYFLLLPLLLLPSCRDGGQTPEQPVDENTVIWLDLTDWRAVDTADERRVANLWDTMHLTATLQGLVNRDAPRLYVEYLKTDYKYDPDRYWWDTCAGSGKWLGDKKVRTMTDPVEALDFFKGYVKGLVVYDPAVASTSCVASTIAGVEDLVAVRYDPSPESLYSRLLADGWEVRQRLLNEDGSSMFHSKLEPYEWAVEKYIRRGKVNPDYAAYYIDQFWRTMAGRTISNHHQLTNHDYFVAKRAFFFDLSPWDDEPATDAPGEGNGDRAMLQSILSELYRNRGGDRFCYIGGFPPWAYKYTNNRTLPGKHSDTATEWEYTRIISNYNAFQDADALSYGALTNASFWQHYPLQDRYPQEWTTREALKAKGFLDAEGKVDLTKKYIIVYVGDYDSAAWLYQKMPQIWDDPKRGTVPLMWSVNPNLAERVPMILNYMRTTATPNDYFASGDNGAGYLNPSMLEYPRPISNLPDGVRAWANYNKPYFEKWGLTITGFVIDGFANVMSTSAMAAYATFSPNGIVNQRLSMKARLVGDLPVLRAGGGISGQPSEVADKIIAAVDADPSFPFFWFRSILQTPSWHADVRDNLQQKREDIVWMDAPSFFELLRCYLQEGHSTAD